MNDKEKLVWGALKLLGYQVTADYEGWITFTSKDLPMVKVEKIK